MYATVEDFRAEGIAEAQASDARLLMLINEAGRVIDRITGWYFEPREVTYLMDGRGAPTVEPLVPPIRLDALMVEDSLFSTHPDDLVIVGAPVQPGFDAPRLTLKHGYVFPKGIGNIQARGLWGYTEDDGTPTGRTPLEIRRACMLLVMNRLPMLSDTEAVDDARNRWRIIEERTRDQSYKLGTPGSSTTLTGDLEVDGILLRYRRPMGLGAV